MAAGVEAVVAAARGDLTARKRIHQDLTRLELGCHWPSTIAALRRIADGQVPAAPDLLDAPDPPGAALVGTVLARLHAAPPGPSSPPRT